MAEINPRIQERRIEIIRAKGKKITNATNGCFVRLLSLSAVLISKSSLLDVDEVVVLGANSELEELIVTVANIPNLNLYLRLILRHFRAHQKNTKC